MLNTGAGARPFPFTHMICDWITNKIDDTAQLIVITVIEATGHRKQKILVWQSYGINRGEMGGRNLCCYVVKGGPNHKPLSDERC